MPFHVTAELVENPVPCTVRRNAALPAGTVAGESEVSEIGGNAWVVKLTEFEATLLEAGSSTVILAVPGAAKSLAGNCAINCPCWFIVVGVAVPLKYTTEVEVKYWPVTVSDKAPCPTVTVVGEMEVITGIAGVILSTKTLEFTSPDAGSWTVMFT